MAPSDLYYRKSQNMSVGSGENILSEVAFCRTSLKNLLSEKCKELSLDL